MRVLFCASEIFPFAKTGGLADVASALPKSLSDKVEINSVMPLYGFMSKEKLQKEILAFSVSLGGIDYAIELYTANNDGIKTYFIDAPLLSATQDLYGDEKGAYTNNDLRFGIFCAAVVELACRLKIDILHLNDWHSALCAFFIKERLLTIKTIFTIHNLAYQGVFEFNALSRLGIDTSYFTTDGLEFYGNINFMKAGIAYSDKITTVSPQYAKEILTKEFGCGLEGFLSLHRKKLSGILNGIDSDFFNPKTDPALVFSYDSQTLEKKYENKKAFLKTSKLKTPKKPLFVMISRLAYQKGFDFLLLALKPLLKKKLNLLILGDGESSYKKSLEKIASVHENFEFRFGYDEDLSHKIYAAADFLLMPSLYEPCGLNQFIAMRYGTIPIVHAVGGLYDSVHEDSLTCKSGIVFKKPTKKALIDAIERALCLKYEQISQINHFNMTRELSFHESAKHYLSLYKEIL